MREGHSRDEAMRLIGCVVTCEIFDMMKQGRAYDHDRFVRALNALPRNSSRNSAASGT